jgi:hypothetical protein
MRPITEIQDLAAALFQQDILPASQPVVIRGLVRHWPLVAVGRQSAEAFCDYLRRFDCGFEVNTAYGPPSIAGRLFYNDDLSGLNCRMGMAKLSGSLDYLLEHARDEPAPTLAIQSVMISRYLPGMDLDNPLPAGLVPPGNEPRLWLGNRAVVAAHYDPSENIACCVAGKRRFTLFPPEQVRNLYVGPFELTPAGATISMVDFDQPDLAAFPRYREAQAAAFEAVLEPGDAIYIPYMWWHHVRSLDSVSGLVNYWWTRVPERCGDPRNVLMHAILAMRSLPPEYRSSWRKMFEHYVFSEESAAGEHLPVERRGIMGELKPEEIKRLRLALSRAFSLE